MLHWWGFSPVDVGRDSRRDRARHSKGGRMRDKKTGRQKTKTKKLKKNKVWFVNGSLLIGKIQSFLASHVLRNLALRWCLDSLEFSVALCQKMALLESYKIFPTKSSKVILWRKGRAALRGSFSVSLLGDYIMCFSWTSSNKQKQ